MATPRRPSPSASPRWFPLCAAIFFAALILRLGYALAQPVWTSADSGYYVMVARNLYRGRGFISDYIWNYLAGLPAGLPAPSNEYWMPGQSVVVAAAFAVARSTALRVAQVPSLVLSALLCAITAWMAGLLSRRRDVALLAGAMAAVSFHLAGTALYPDHFGLVACLVNLSLLALWAAWRGSPTLALVAGGIAGLAYLTRNDGALLGVVALFLAFDVWRKRGLRPAAGYALCFGGAFALIAAPWWVRQYSVFGHLAGAGALRTAYLTSYNDLFRLDQSHLDLSHYLQTSQTFAAMFKGYVLFTELRLLAKVVGVAGLLALVALRRAELRREATPWLVYLGLGLLAPAFIVPYPTVKGGFWHLMPGLCPILFGLGAGEAVRIFEWGRQQKRSLLKAAAWSPAVLSLAWLLAWWAALPQEVARGASPSYPLAAREAARALQPPLHAALTDDCWGLYEVARVPCAQFPSDGAAAALQVAEAIGANYLITRADAPKRLPAITEVVGHPRFRPAARYPTPEGAVLVYDIVPPAPSSDSRRRMSQ